MKKKMIIIAGVILAIFLVFLILLGGSAGTNKTVTKEEIETNFTNVVCEVFGEEETITYDISTLTNDISFDSILKNKQYTKIKLNNSKDIKSLGIAFIVKSNEDINLNVSLNLNDISLKTTSVELKDGKMKSVNLLLTDAVEITTTDEFTITFEQTENSDFSFDTILFFFDNEV